MTAPDSGVLTSAEFDALFDSFTNSVVRLEQLPAYSVGGAEAERIAAWRRGEPRPERSVRTSPWLARIATSTAVDGKRWQRVRVVDEPLTDYQRYQLESYRESQAAGEEISIALRADAPDRWVDFWLFDRGTPQARAVWMKYDREGRLQRREFTNDERATTAMASIVASVQDVAMPLNVFLARAVRGG